MPHSVYLNDAEWEAICTAARNRDLTPAVFIRKAALHEVEVLAERPVCEEGSGTVLELAEKGVQQIEEIRPVLDALKATLA